MKKCIELVIKKNLIFHIYSIISELRGAESFRGWDFVSNSRNSVHSTDP